MGVIMRCSRPGHPPRVAVTTTRDAERPPPGAQHREPNTESPTTAP